MRCIRKENMASGLNIREVVRWEQTSFTSTSQDPYLVQLSTSLAATSSLFSTGVLVCPPHRAYVVARPTAWQSQPDNDGLL